MLHSLLFVTLCFSGPTKLVGINADFEETATHYKMIHKGKPNLTATLRLIPKTEGETIRNTYGLYSQSAEHWTGFLVKKKKDKLEVARVNMTNGLSGEKLSVRAFGRRGETEIHINHRETKKEAAVLFATNNERRVFLGTVHRTKFAIVEIYKNENGVPYDLQEIRYIPGKSTGIYEIRSGEELLGRLTYTYPHWSIALKPNPEAMPKKDVMTGIMLFPYLNNLVSLYK